MTKNYKKIEEKYSTCRQISRLGWSIAILGILFGIDSTKSEGYKIDRIKELNLQMLIWNT